MFQEQGLQHGLEGAAPARRHAFRNVMADLLPVSVALAFRGGMLTVEIIGLVLC